METPETPQENYKTATEALENIGNMAQEMEKNYEEKIQVLKLQFEDACAQAEKYLLENQELKKKLEADKALGECVKCMSDVLGEENEELTSAVNKLSEKVDELEKDNEDLIDEVGSLIVEAQEARRSFTAFQLAVSLLIFVYGMMYGVYFGKCV